MTRFACRLCCLNLILFLAAAASGQTILFSDSFDRISGTPDVNGSDGGISSWGDNDNAAGGSILQTYEVGPLPPRAGNRHQYVDGNLGRFRAGWAEIQHDFGGDSRVDQGGGLSIVFDATVADLTPGWLGLAIGQTSAETTDVGTNPNGSGSNDNSSIFLPVEDTIDFGVLFKGQDGVYEIFEGDDFASNNNDAFIVAATGDWLAGQDANQQYNFRVEIATTDFGGSGVMATANVYVTTPSIPFVNHVIQDYVFDWDDNGEAYIGFSSNKDQACPTDDCVDQEVRIDNLVISTLMTVSTVTGDFNGDGNYDCQDVDSLVAEIVAGTNTLSFDLTGDSLVNGDDLAAWLVEGGNAEVGGPFLPGDANLDGSVDVSDFNVWNGSKFQPVAAWCSGDFNADGSIDVSDFNIWNGRKFQSSGNTLVPEPGSWGLLWGAVCWGTLGFRRR